VPYSTPVAEVVVEMEEAMELGATVAEVLGPLLQMVLMEPEVEVLVSPQVQTLGAQGAMG